MISFHNFHRIPDPLELHCKIQQIRKQKYEDDLMNQIKQQQQQQLPEIKVRIASATNLLKSKYSDGNRMFDDREVAQYSKLPLYQVQSLKAGLEREDSEKDPIFVGWKRKSGGYVSYVNGLPTRR
jgi:hypothetical protein